MLNKMLFVLRILVFCCFVLFILDRFYKWGIFDKIIIGIAFFGLIYLVLAIVNIFTAVRRKNQYLAGSSQTPQEPQPPKDESSNSKA